MASEILTPMMQQFKRFKSEHPDALILFRCGDFYETYLEDAVTASSVLGITLTHRSSKGDGKGTEMAGFPFHALDAYLPKLIRAGFRVAICDQLEDPKLTKKLVKRGITEVVTPGVAMDDNVLQKKTTFLLPFISATGRADLPFSTYPQANFSAQKAQRNTWISSLPIFRPRKCSWKGENATNFLRFSENITFTSLTIGLSMSAVREKNSKNTLMFAR